MTALIICMHSIRIRLALRFYAEVLESNIRCMHHSKQAIFGFAIRRFGIARAGDYHLLAVARTRNKLNAVFCRGSINIINHHVFGISAVFNQESHSAFNAIGKRFHSLAYGCIISLARRTDYILALQALCHASCSCHSVNLFSCNFFATNSERG